MYNFLSLLFILLPVSLFVLLFLNACFSPAKGQEFCENRKTEMKAKEVSKRLKLGMLERYGLLKDNTYVSYIKDDLSTLYSGHGKDYISDDKFCSLHEAHSSALCSLCKRAKTYESLLWIINIRLKDKNLPKDLRKKFEEDKVKLVNFMNTLSNAIHKCLRLDGTVYGRNLPKGLRKDLEENKVELVSFIGEL